MDVQDNLYYAREFNRHTWSEHPEANRFITYLWDKFFSKEFSQFGRGKRPRIGLREQLKVLILDLYLNWSDDPIKFLGVHMRPQSYVVNSRYKSTRTTALVIKLIHYASYLGLIEFHEGNEGANRVSRIRPTTMLKVLWGDYEFNPLDIATHENKEVIILNEAEFDDILKKKKKSLPIEYKDSDNASIPQMRGDLEKYNKLLRETFIDIPTLKIPVIKHEKKVDGFPIEKFVNISQHNKFVRRIFYRGSWGLGGRFHGGWWQQLGEEWRKQIYINDKPTYEQDYSGLHVNLAYGLEDKLPKQDPYTVDPITGFDKVEQRRVIKKFVLITINSNSIKSACSAFRKEEETGSIYKKFRNKDLQVLLDAFIEKNQIIKNYLCSDKGVDFMALDGRITARIINYFTNKSVPILTIHDSYISNHKHAKELITVMNKAIKKEIGVKINIDEEDFVFTEALANPGNELFKMKELLDYQDNTRHYTKTNEYKQRLKQFHNNQRNIQ